MEKKAPLISIIIPVYNGEMYIRRCLDSILLSEFMDYEIIIIDDGSTDKSEQIVFEYLKQYPNLTFYKQLNSGPSVARNKGIESAKGEFIKFIDCDDSIHPKMFTKLLEGITQNNPDIIFHGYQIIDDNQIINEFVPENLKVSKNETLDNFYIHLDKQRILSSPWTALFKKEIIETNNIKFPINLKYGEDVNFLISYMTHCESFMSIKDILYYNHKDNSESLSSGYIREVHKIMHINQNAKLDFFKEKDIFNPDLQKYFANKHVELLYYNIRNLYKENSDYVGKERIQEVAKIIKNPVHINWINKSDISQPLKYNILKILVKGKSPFLIDFLLKIISSSFYTSLKKEKI